MVQINNNIDDFFRLNLKNKIKSALIPSVKPLGPISTFAPIGMLDLS
jgi:hypothetical protein